MLVSQVTPLFRITQDPAQLRNFKTTIYGSENVDEDYLTDPEVPKTVTPLFRQAKTLDLMSIVFTVFLLIFMFIQIVYKENNINTEYLFSAESTVNLLIVTFVTLAYINARSISDTDTSVQHVLQRPGYTDGYYDFGDKIE